MLSTEVRPFAWPQTCDWRDSDARWSSLRTRCRSTWLTAAAGTISDGRKPVRSQSSGALVFVHQFRFRAPCPLPASRFRTAASHEAGLRLARQRLETRLGRPAAVHSLGVTTLHGGCYTRSSTSAESRLLQHQYEAWQFGCAEAAPDPWTDEDLSQLKEGVTNTVNLSLRAIVELLHQVVLVGCRMCQNLNSSPD